VDSSGNVWIATQWAGLVKFDGTNWTVYTASNSGLPDNRVRTIAVDDNNDIWIGTNSGFAVFYPNMPVNISDNNKGGVAADYFLSQNYPNPFNPATTIVYSLPARNKVSIIVYDLLGKEVAELVNEEKPAGSYEIQFNGSRLSSGVYFYRMRAGRFISIRKLLLMK
jgi:hypothetical protein